MRWRIALVIVAAILIAHALWLAVADPADADDHGLVVTCQTVDLWDVRNLGTVTVTRPGGVATYTPGNALTVAYVTAAGPVTAVVTAHHSYTVTAPSGCATTTTTTSSSTTTSVPVPTPSTAPPSTVPPSVPSSTVPGPTVPPPPSVPGTTPPTATTLPPAPPAQPVVATPAFTG